MVVDDVFCFDVPFRGEYKLKRLRFGNGSPKIVLVAGMHGNELIGVHVVNLLASFLREHGHSGQVDIFPMINTFGIEEARKLGPVEEDDVNESLPGDENGTAVKRIAAVLLKQSVADVCIDIHSGSKVIYEIPQVRTTTDEHTLALTKSMKLPFVWRRDEEKTSGLIGSWRAEGRTAFRIMAGRADILNHKEALVLVEGLKLLMTHLGMIDYKSSLDMQTIADVDKVHVHRCDTGGFFVPQVSVGQIVEPGQMLGRIVSPLGGTELQAIKANIGGLVTNLREYPMVHAQELLVRIA